MARSVCAQVTQDLVQIVPQLSDYTCPVCLAIVWRPIRMECNHVLCVRCTVFMQRRGTNACPLCRDEVILKADQGSFQHTDPNKVKESSTDAYR